MTLLDRAPYTRTAGQNIDVRGAGHAVLRKMGLHDAAKAQTTGERGTRWYDEDGAPYAEMPVRKDGEGPTAELEILRGKLSELIVGLTSDGARTSGPVQHHYGKHVVRIEQDDDEVRVTLADGSHARFDLMVVAEGRNSHTRDLVFGDAVTYEQRGMYIAYGTIPRNDSDDGWWQWMTATAGRVIAVRPDNVGTTRATLSFRAPDLGLDRLPHDIQMQILRQRYRGVGWQADRVLDGFTAAPDEFYLERTDRVLLPEYARGRVIVVGDAAWAGGPTGVGSTLALLSAYVLGGEMDAARRDSTIDHARAFSAYERALRPYADKVQAVPAITTDLVLPRSKHGARLLRGIHEVAAMPLARVLAKHNPLSRIGTTFDLPDYRIYDDSTELAS